MDRRNGEEEEEGRHGIKKKGKKLSLKFSARLLDLSTDIPKILQLNCILRKRRVNLMFTSFFFFIAVSSPFSCPSSFPVEKGKLRQVEFSRQKLSESFFGLNRSFDRERENNNDARRVVSID